MATPESPFNVVFMGSPQPAATVLDAVARMAASWGWTIRAVYTAPDRKAGRGRKMQRSPVKERALALGLDVMTPARVTPAEEQERFKALNPDLVVLAAYGLILPDAFLFVPRHGAVNVHPSLLPRWRGAAPVPAAIIAGDDVTGTSIMVMNEGLDTGPVIASRSVPLDGSERSPELMARLFHLGAELLAESLPAYIAGALAPRIQADDGVTVVKRFHKQDGVLDWTKTAVALERQVRALDPWPGSATTWDGKRLEVVEARVGVLEPRAAPGSVVRGEMGVGVATGEGVLLLRRVKLEGRPATAIDDFVRGHEEFLVARLGRA
jgi:methionyl-tRNA formyltransferase